MIHRNEYPPQDGKLRTALKDPSRQFIEKIDIPERNIYIVHDQKGVTWVIFDDLFYIFKRGDLYLSNMYEWESLPSEFAEHRKAYLESMFSGMTKPPTHYALVHKSVDLDTVEWLPVNG